MLDSNDALSIKVSKKNLVKEHVQNNLVYITSNFKVLSESILKLQTKNIPSAESLSIVDNVQTQLKSVQGEPGFPWSMKSMKKWKMFCLKISV